MTSAAIVNVGAIVTGRLEAPLLDGDAVLIRDGRIAAIGRRADIDLGRPDLVIDAGGATLAPGLIDSHCHVVIGDYTPRQKTVDFLESYTHGGISRVITASEVHAPGRPRDPAGVKALAITAARCFEHYRPGGMIVHAGSVILEPGLTEADFIELKQQGVWLAKAGFGNFERPSDCAPLVHLARKHGFKVMVHTGGASIPGSSPVTAADLLAMQPDVSGHANGGPTALSDEDVATIIERSTMYLQVVQAGNLRSAIDIARRLAARGELSRLLIATDTPTGTGTMPLGMIKSVVELSSLAGLPPEVAIAAASGNVARAYGVPAGVLEVGAPADLMLMDAPLGSHDRDALHAISRGDIPGISCLFTLGELRYVVSRNTPPVTRRIRVVEDRTHRWS